MIRRFVAALAATVLLASLSISSVAAADPAGVLRASFQGYNTGGLGATYATWVRGAPAGYHAASTGVDLEAGAARISLFPPIQEHCSSNLFGVWVAFLDSSRAGLEGATYTMSFGPEGDPAPLAIQETAVKRATDAQGWYWGGDPVWWQSVGVPVYGRLAVGDYEFHATYDFPGYAHFEWDAHISIVDC